ncbi:MAG: hypothetical protein HRT68_06220 [Flavobacteriaceae bacterium]|nr:hypothetical protein [Flavobacteriaceae bacterium]
MTYFSGQNTYGNDTNDPTTTSNGQNAGIQGANNCFFGRQSGENTTSTLNSYFGFRAGRNSLGVGYICL